MMDETVSAACTLLANELRSEFDVRFEALLVSGSHAYGTPRRGSDVDVQLVARGANLARQMRIAHGYTFDLWVSTYERLLDRIQARDGPMLKLLGGSVAVTDASERVLDLVRMARERFEDGPGALSPGQQTLMRIQLMNKIRDLTERDFTSPAGRYVVVASMTKAVELALGIANRYRTKHVIDFEEIGAFDPKLQQQLTRALEASADCAPRELRRFLEVLLHWLSE